MTYVVVLGPFYLDGDAGDKLCTTIQNGGNRLHSQISQNQITLGTKIVVFGRVKKAADE